MTDTVLGEGLQENKILYTLLLSFVCVALLIGGCTTPRVVSVDKKSQEEVVTIDTKQFRPTGSGASDVMLQGYIPEGGSASIDTSETEIQRDSIDESLYQARFIVIRTGNWGRWHTLRSRVDGKEKIYGLNEALSRTNCKHRVCQFKEVVYTSLSTEKLQSIAKNEGAKFTLFGAEGRSIEFDLDSDEATKFLKKAHVIEQGDVKTAEGE